MTALLVAAAVFSPTVAEARSHVTRRSAGIENLRIPAAIVVDAKTGQMLYGQNADDARYPASITKVMTLYILFQELSSGRLKLNSLLNVSAHSAAASPTKLGLRAGSKIRVEDAIKSIVTISANDMARTIAESISGSEDAFARRMTATAHALGMTHTVYYNASGLPDGRQRTTVRDQAILASAIYEHFPQYYGYFQTRQFAYGKRVYGNHDYVLGYMGVDGIKTGYINAAGYNLMTASRQGDRHLVVVAFGFNTGGQRDARVRSLVQKYLPQARAGQYLASAVIQIPGRRGAQPEIRLASAEAAPAVVKPMPPPAFRDEQPMPEPVAYAPEPALPPTQVASLRADTDQPPTPMDIGVQPAVDVVSAVAAPSGARGSTRPDVVGQSLNNMLLGAPPAALGQTPASAPLVPPVGIGEKNQPFDLMTSGSISSRQVADAALRVESAVLGKGSDAPADDVADEIPAASPAESGSWIVQIGAAPTRDGATSLLSSASHKVANLSDMRPYIERFDKDGQTFYRARFVGFGDQKEAAGMCNRLKKAKMSCLAMQS